MTNQRSPHRITGYLLAAGCLLFWTGTGLGYDSYNGCAPCHPGFQDQGPTHHLHVGSSHMTTTCLLCHRNVGDTPKTHTSGVANGQGCRGCHGVDNGTAFEWGAGLRKHHQQSGINDCQPCHTDAPGSVLPENTVPVYYLRTDVQIDDPCATATPGGEDWDGDGFGLDNDGDLDYDAADSDCSGAGIGDLAVPPPLQLRLQAIAPNPALRSGADLRFGVAQRVDVSVRVFDVNGRQVATRELPSLSPGWHVYHFDGLDAGGRRLARGVYVVRLQTGRAAVSGRVILID